MAGHGDIVHFNGPQNTSKGVSDANSYRSMNCGHCSRDVVAAVIAMHPGQMTSWTTCPSCNGGTVFSGEIQYPGPKVGGDVDGLPGDVSQAYQEARACASVAAYTAAEVMCRKILMHVAVDKGAEAGKSFAFYLTYLGDQGYVTPPMKPWVEVIRKNGNIAVHEIPATDKERALGTLIFTEQLLRMVYLMEHLANKYAPGP
ncbi:DUF4145 domain-containing protein [Streptomyces sp. NBC_00210]|uniref:DUF4145 domain-containing protein n=1 Tax=Streptomyces sp. NBC_00210 TaxID=2903636 RepID=UPI0032495700